MYTAVRLVWPDKRPQAVPGRFFETALASALKCPNAQRSPETTRPTRHSHLPTHSGSAPFGPSMVAMRLARTVYSSFRTECLNRLRLTTHPMPSADCRHACNSPLGSPSPISDTSRGTPVCFPRVAAGSTWRAAVTAGLPIELHPRPRALRLISGSCSTAHVFASGFLPVTIAGIRLPLATLRRHPAGAGLVCQRRRTPKQPGSPGTTS